MKSFVLSLLLFALASAPTPAAGQDFVLLNGTVGISAGNHWRIAFNANDGDRVRGWFRVADKDVICFVLDADNYDLYSKSFDFFSVYNSGKVTAASLNVRLRRGSYVLVISNKHAAWYSKTVAGRIRLER